MADKTILHCDLNNFFASVECLKHPELKGYPVAVCGSIENRHGIILAKNEEAKKYGIKTAEVVWQAKQKCPDLVLLSPHMEEYHYYSCKVFDIYSQYTDLIEAFGIDECWLDVTGSNLLFGDGETIANTLRERIKKELSLTISVGVSFTKIFAKLGSDMKKPDAVTCITKENYQNKVWPLPVNELLGIGKSTMKTLDKFGIRTIGDLAKTDIEFLKKQLGKSGEYFHAAANGYSDDTVSNKDSYEAAKSIGNSTTCKSDLFNNDEAWTVFYSLAESVSARLRRHGFYARGIQITIKDNSLAVKEFQCSLNSPTRHPKELAQTAFALFTKHYDWSKPVRMLGIRTFHFTDDNQSIQYNMFSPPQKTDELEQLEAKIDILREKYGSSSIKRASLMGEAADVQGHEKKK